MVALMGTTFGSEAVYSCDVGHRIIGGDTTRMCMDTAIWSGIEPMCESKIQQDMYNKIQGLPFSPPHPPPIGNDSCIYFCQ